MEYSCRLRRLVGQCDFDAATSAMLLRDIFVCGIFSNLLGERLLSEDAAQLTFDSAIARAEAWERAKNDRQSVDNSNIAHVYKSSSNLAKNPPAPKKCYRCNSSEHLANCLACPARNEICHGCGAMGHFKAVCRSSRGNSHHSNNTYAGRKEQKGSDTRQQVATITTASFGNAQDFSVYANTPSSEDMKRFVSINGEPVEI